jgi:hypothetical protein
MKTILLGCSPDARAAVRVAGGLFDGTTTIVLTVWEDLSEVVARAGSGLATASLDFERIDRAREQAAGELAEEGTSHARASGLPAASLAPAPERQTRRGARGAIRPVWGLSDAAAVAEQLQ